MLHRVRHRVRYREIRRPHLHFCKLSYQLFAPEILGLIPRGTASIFFVFNFLETNFVFLCTINFFNREKHVYICSKFISNYVKINLSDSVLNFRDHSSNFPYNFLKILISVISTWTTFYNSEIFTFPIYFEIPQIFQKFDINFLNLRMVV